MKSILSLSIFLLAAFILQNCNEISAQDILAEANFSIENVKYLEVKGGFCNIELYGYSGSALKMDGNITGKGDEDKYEIIYREEDGKIKVWVERPNNIWGNIQGLLKFDVPENVLVVVDNSSGNVEAIELKAGEIKLGASSGNIKASKMSGELNIKCS